MHGLLRWFGRILVVVSLGFIGWRLRDHAGPIFSKPLSPVVLVGVAAFSIFYAMANMLLARGWWMTLNGLEKHRLSWSHAWRLYAKTQIAKYLPGNIFHLASRHVHARKRGISDAALACATGIEMAMILAFAGMLSVFTPLNALPLLGQLGSRSFFYLAAGFCLVVAMALIIWYRGIRKIISPERWRCLLEAQVAYSLYVFISALLFLGICAFFEGSDSIVAKNWLLIIGAYAFSWSAGFITPGAPGGLGIREVTLVALLGGKMGESAVLSAALVFRLVTTFGDLVFFSLSAISGKGRSFPLQTGRIIF